MCIKALSIVWFVFAILLLSGLSMRIKSPNDLEGLGLHARKQIEAVLNSSKKSVNGNLLPNNKSQSKNNLDSQDIVINRKTKFADGLNKGLTQI